MKGELFFELLQMALGMRDHLSRVPSAAEWERLFEEAERQAVVGVMLGGIERLVSPLGSYGNHRGQEPRFIKDEISVSVPMIPLEVKLQWIGEAQIIEEQNRVISKACREVIEQLEKDGFWCCVLKGQANLRYYPKRMMMRRNPGDIDIWTVPNVVNSEKGKSNSYLKHPVRKTLEYVERKHGLTGLCWLHCNFDYKEDVPVEVHFRPSFMNEPLHNRRLQRFFKNYEFNELGFSVLPVEVDVVYQMNHIYRHLIDEGVGLRQIVDYYWLLKKFHTEDTDHMDITRMVEWLGMKRFARALMYVLKEVCGMAPEYLLYEPNEKDGKFLLSEIMTAGNFGQADPRMGDLNTSSTMKRQLSQAWRRFRRNMRFFTSYPGEVIWEPVARMEHFAWKKLKLWRF